MATDALQLLRHRPVVFWDPEADEELLCIDVRSETHDVKTFTFRAKEGRLFSVEPGQYFSFQFEVGTEVHSRCYSISSSALGPTSFSITVKRVEGGLVSNWVHDHLRVGATVRAHGPGGRFVLPGSQGPYLFISGGSGITPVMAMVRTLADAGAHPDIVFVHAARTPQDLVFRDELEWRARRTPNFRLIFLPERSTPDGNFSGATGRISQALLAAAVPDLADRTVMCCGPAPFMKAVKALASTLGVPDSRYHEESFTVDEPVAPGVEPGRVEADAPAAGAQQTTCTITFAKRAKAIEVKAGLTVLAAARQAGISLPSSCANGVCGTCKSKLVSGRVEMNHNGGIRQREIDAGFFLPCCAKPLTDLVVDR